MTGGNDEVKKRNSGYYWIAVKGRTYWEPGLFLSEKGEWQRIGSPNLLKEKEIEEVGKPILFVMQGGKKYHPRYQGKAQPTNTCNCCHDLWDLVVYSANPDGYDIPINPEEVEVSRCS